MKDDTESRFDRRAESLSRAMEEAQLDAVVIWAAPTELGNGTTTSGSIRWLCDWADRSRPSAMVYGRTCGRVLLPICSPLDRGWVEERAAHPTAIIPVGSVSGLGTVAAEQISKIAGAGRIGLVGWEEARWDAGTALRTGLPRGTDLINADRLFAELKANRDSDEILLQRAAAVLSDVMHESGFALCRAGNWRLRDVMAETEAAGRRGGADYAACWVSGGKAPITIAHQLWECGEATVEPHERIQIGTYVMLEGYWGHAIRIAVRGGEASTEMTEAFDTVCAAQAAGADALRPGGRVGDVVAAMDEVLEEAAPMRQPDAFRVRTGHCLGLQYAEPLYTDSFPADPRTRQSLPQAEVEIREGMVFELHPNLATPELGWVAIGDMYEVTPTSAERLTRQPREILRL